MAIENKTPYTLESFDWKKIKTLLSDFPELKDKYDGIESDTKLAAKNLRKEVTFFQEVQKMPDYSQLKAEFEKLLPGQKRRIQGTLGFGGELLDSKWGPRMYIILKNFSFKNKEKNYSLQELSYTDEDGKKLAEYVEIARKLAGKDVKGIQKKINATIAKKSEKIEEDGALGPDTFGELIKNPNIWKETPEQTPLSTPPLQKGEIKSPDSVKFPYGGLPKEVQSEGIPLIDSFLQKGREGKSGVQPEGFLNSHIYGVVPTGKEKKAEERKAEVDTQETAKRGPIPRFIGKNDVPDILQSDSSRTFLAGNNFPISVESSRENKANTDEKITKNKELQESILDVKKQLGINENDKIEKKGDNYVILSQNGRKTEITNNDSEKYTLVKYLYRLEKSKEMISSTQDIGGLGKAEKKTIENILHIKLLGLSLSQQYKLLNQSEVLKLLTVEELSEATIIDDDDFVSIFSKDGVKKGDIISTTEEGLVIIFNRDSKKVTVKNDIKDLPIESMYEKFISFKGEFVKLNDNEKTKLFKAFQIQNATPSFKEFFAQIYTKPLFQTIQSLKDITDLEGVKDISSLKKYGIDAQMMKDLGVKEGDFYRYDKAAKKLILFRGNNDGMKEEIGTDKLIRIAFQSSNIESIKNLVSLEANNKQFIQLFKDLIRRDRVRAREKLFFNLPLNLGPNAGNGKKINFYGSPHLKNIITPYDLFGDFQYLKMDGIIYKRAPENGDTKQEGEFEAMETLEQRVRRGDFYGKEGQKMKISSDGVGIITEVPNQETEAFEASFNLDTLIEALEDIKGSSKKKEFITLIQSTIKKRNLFKQVREKFIGLTPLEKFASIFTSEKNKDIPQILKENLSVYDFFGDATYINIDGVIYKNDGSSLFRDEYGNEAPKLNQIKNTPTEQKDIIKFFDIGENIRLGKFSDISEHYGRIPSEKKEQFEKNLRSYFTKLDSLTALQERFMKNGKVEFSNILWSKVIGTKELLGTKIKYIKVGNDIYQNDGKGDFLSLTNDKKLVLSNGLKIEEVRNIDSLTYTPLAKAFGKYTVNNFKFGRRLATGNTGCGKGTGDTISAFGIEGFTMGDFEGSRDGYKWKEILDDAVERGQFIKVKINHPDDAKGGAILTYDRGAVLGTKNRRLYGHAEIKGEDGRYRHANVMDVPAGSAHTNETDPVRYRKLTGFTGYAYYPVRKTA